jgi:hypothetical protein
VRFLRKHDIAIVGAPFTDPPLQQRGGSRTSPVASGA